MSWILLMKEDGMLRKKKNQQENTSTKTFSKFTEVAIQWIRAAFNTMLIWQYLEYTANTRVWVVGYG